MKWQDSKLKLYLDTTIPSYVFATDTPQRMAVTRHFLRLGRERHEMVISDVVLEEIQAAAEPKRSLLFEQVQHLKVLPMTSEAAHLARIYIQMNILPKSSFDDVRHVALATLNRVDALIIWNFSHLVNMRRTKAINLLHSNMNLQPLAIVTPEEVLE